MRLRAQIQSFRARLLLLLALMLGLTLGIQYYFNLRSVKNNARMIIEQEQAIMTGIALGLESIQSEQYLVDMIDRVQDPLLAHANVRVKNIMVVDDDGNIIDSLLKEYIPHERDDRTTQYIKVQGLQLPPLRSAAQYTEQEQLPTWIPPSTSGDFGAAGAIYLPV